MSARRSLILLAAVTVLLSARPGYSCLTSRSPELRRADRLIQQKRWHEASRLYLRLANDGFEPRHRYKMLWNAALGFVFSGDLRGADRVYDQLVFELPRKNALYRHALRDFAKLTVRMRNVKKAVELHRYYLSLYPRTDYSKQAHRILRRTAQENRRR